MKKLLLITLLIGIANACYADSDLYKVEVILFKRTGQGSRSTEDIQSHIKPQLPVSLIELTSTDQDDDAPEIPFSLLKEDQMDMKREEIALARNKNYNVILHIAWLQPMNKKRYSKSVHIYAGKLENNLDENTVSTIHKLPNPDENTSGLWEIEGTIRANRSNHFVLNTQLTFSMMPSEKQGFNFFNNASPESGNDSEVKHYYLSQSQNIKKGEIHYFDHPLFGMLAKITPVEQDQT